MILFFLCFYYCLFLFFFFFSSRRRHTRWNCDWSSDVCSSDLRPHTKQVKVIARNQEAPDALIVALAAQAHRRKSICGRSFQHVVSVPEVLVEIGRASCRERV